MTSLSDALQAAGASAVFWIVLSVILVVAVVGYLLTRDHVDSAPKDNSKVVQDWIPTGRIDFAGPTTHPDSVDTPSLYHLQAEETRVLMSVSGIERREIRWRKATLSEAKRVVSIYHRNVPSAPSIMGESHPRSGSNKQSQS